mmetsp:Transcript_18531/g.39915  ORF Transcript_18531/g.39915 Transcript_18531/m.39915 type:complete len:158 (-) Transcript_18531:70-543(-)
MSHKMALEPFLRHGEARGRPSRDGARVRVCACAARLRGALVTFAALHCESRARGARPHSRLRRRSCMEWPKLYVCLGPRKLRELEIPQRTKDTVEILQKLNKAYPVAADVVEEKVQSFLGPQNKLLVQGATEAISAGDVQRLGELMTEYQVWGSGLG